MLWPLLFSCIRTLQLKAQDSKSGYLPSRAQTIARHAFAPVLPQCSGTSRNSYLVWRFCVVARELLQLPDSGCSSYPSNQSPLPSVTLAGVIMSSEPFDFGCQVAMSCVARRATSRMRRRSTTCSLLESRWLPLLFWGDGLGLFKTS